MNVSGCLGVNYNGIIYFNSGTYQQTLTNAAGCDSNLTVHVVVNFPSQPTTLQESTCGSFTLNDSTYTSSGTYSQTLTNSVGCDSVVQLTLTIDSLEVSATQSDFTLTASAPPSSTLQWVDCANGYAPIPGETNPDFLVTANGNYAVIADNGICADTSDCFLFTSVGLDADFLSQITYYPNPSNGQLTIELGQVFEQIEVEVWNALGQQVSQFQSQADEQLSLLLPKETGIYFLRIQADKRQAMVKVLRK